MNKSFLSLLICSLLLYTEVKSQSNCLFGGDLTNGVSAELITANDGVSLLGIRVLWTIKSEYLNCQFTSLRVELNSGERRRDITVNDSSEDFYVLDCNTEYIPRVRATVPLGITFTHDGDSLFFGGNLTSTPSRLLRVCFGPIRSGKVDIYWDLLPCHRQNGADITGYIIQYSPTSGGEARNISNSDNRVDCGVESGGRYSCLLPYSSLFTTEVPYSFQVAAVNRYGVGPFSDTVIGMIPNQNETCSSTDMPDEASTAAGLPTTSTQITLHPVVRENNTFPEIVTGTNQNTFTTLHPSLENQVQSNTILSYSGWIVAGSIFVILAGVIILLAVLNCILWKRLKSASLSNTDQTNAKLDVSEIDMKECSAYGRLTSTKTTSADEHVYESTN